MNVCKVGWILLVWVSLSLSAGAVAAQDPVESWESTASYSFGQSVVFELEGETAVSPQSITLIINTPTFANPVSVQADDWETVNGVVKVSIPISSKALKLPPFSTAVYWWEVETADGVFKVTERSFFYEDDRFDWHLFNEGRWYVHWTGETDLGNIGLQALQQSQESMDALLETDDRFPVNLYIYPSTAELRAAFLLNDLDWAGDGTDLPAEVVLVTAVNPLTAATDLQQSVPYVLAKFWLDRGGARLPYWLYEGVARSVVPGRQERGLVETAVSTETAIPFSDLCASFPDTQAGVNLAAAQSASFVTYIRAEYGAQAVQQLINAYRDGAGCDAGVVQTVNKSLDALNQEWLKEYRSYPPLVQFVIDNSLWFLLILFMMFITGFLVWKL